MMLWRVWAFATGLPTGATVGWVLLGTPPAPDRLLYCAIGFSLFWVLLLSFVALLRESDRARGLHLAIAASSGLVGVPALVAARAQLSSAPALLVIPIGVMGAAVLYSAVTRARPGGWLRQLVFGLAFLALGEALILGTAAAVASSRVAPPVFDERRAVEIYDIDARVVNRPHLVCGPKPANIEVMLERGARPRLGADGRLIWFDAEFDGRRQIHRLELASGRVVCWTCGEKGNNLRPAPGGRRGAIVFETDRHTTIWEPFNTELHAMRGGASGPSGPSRRLTRNSVPDDHVIAGPEPNRIVWSRIEDGRYSVMTARIRNTSDGPALGAAEALESGGSAWLVPVAWSPNARALVIASGNPFRPLAAHSIDFATGAVSSMAGGLAASGAAAFNSDGGLLVTARAGGFTALGLFGLLPAEMGFALAEHATRRERMGPLLGVGRPTIRVTELGSLGEDLSLGEAGQWGAVTGLAATPDGTLLVMGQQRAVGGGVEERLLRVALDCRITRER